MSITAPLPTTVRAQSTPVERPAVTQYSRRQIAAIWAAATLPMAFLAWVLSPWLADRISGPSPLTKALLLTLTGGLIWQFVLVAGLVWREQRSLRWSRVREALWLSAPRSPKTGRRGGRVWLIVIPFILLFGVEQFVPEIRHAASRDFGAFLGSDAGHAFFSGAWGWFALVVVLLLFNTVLGEELLFRGLLLPRMNGVFGERDWIANGVLFAAYHLHMPWAIPATLIDTVAMAYPAKRYRSALVGIAVHSAQSVFILAIVLPLVLG